MQDAVVKFLFVGRISNVYKNIYFMLDNFLMLHQKHPHTSFTLVGEVIDKDFFVRYQKEIAAWIIIYAGKKSHADVCAIRTTVSRPCGVPKTRGLITIPVESEPAGIITKLGIVV